MRFKSVSPAAPALAAAFAAFGACAADKPSIGPPPAWVSLLPQPPEPSKAAANAAVAVLLEDVQLHFDETGWSQFNEYQAKAQTAQGLDALGTLSFTWEPATDNVTVHRLRILRGDKVIDLMPKGGAFTILRRETQLDSAATLTGVLTAVVQPEGLQVGDIIDLATTTRREDPLFKGRVDGALSGEDAAPVARLRLRATWPKAAATRWRALDGMPEPGLAEHDGRVEASVDAHDVLPQPKPEGAPARFRRGRELDVSNYASWAEASALMAPLYARAEQLGPNSAVAAEAKAIAATTRDPAARTAAALALVQEKVRYVARAMGAAGYTPAMADATWEARFGDCKGKTVLLIALLKALGIEAEPVLVSTGQGDGLDTRLPGISPFDHVIVHAVVAGRDYWLDGTRNGDRDLAAVSTPDFGFVLPVRERGAALVKLTPEPAKTPLARLAVRIDASAGVDKPAPFHVDAVFRGDPGLWLKQSLANLSPDDLDRALKAYWRKTYDAVEPSKVSAVYDTASGEERLSMDGVEKMDWSNGGYEADGAVLGWRFDARRDPGPHADAPFSVGFPVYDQKTETVVLPDKGRGFTVWGTNVDVELGGYAFHRRADIAGGAFHFETSMRSLSPEITLAQARKDAPALTELGKGTLRIRSPKQTAKLEEDQKALLASTPTTRSGFIERGDALLDDGRYADALKDFDKAVDLDPGSAEALALRGLAHAWLGQSAAAKADLDRAAALDPSQIVVWHGRGVIAARDDRWDEAIAAFTQALQIDTSDAFSLSSRANAFAGARDYPHALADLDALEKTPHHTSVTAARARIYVLMHQPERARALAAATTAADEPSLRNRISTLLAAKDRAGARAVADQLIADFPSAESWFVHALVRDPEDRAGREADDKAALALDKAYRPALAALAQLRARAGDFTAALGYADALVALAPAETGPHTTRGMVRAKAGRAEDARQDFTFVRSRSLADAGTLNNLCYDEATTNFDLDRALADCDASLALRPKDAATLDSRAFVLLRLGRDKEALAAYDATIALRPDQAASLYGRSLAERRLGDTPAADRDLKAAVAQDDHVVKEFADYGVVR